MIPLATISGSEFLVGYVIAFLAANLWAASSRRRHSQAVSSALQAEIDDPQELAFLAGGARRVTQLAVIRLIIEARVEWNKKWTGARLVARPNPPHTPSTSQIEMAILTAVAGRGNKGLSVNRILPIVTPLLRPVEVRLATLGLRPTAAERASGSTAAVWPLILLTIFGIARIALGIVRDRPVGFLVVAVVLTVLAVVLWAKPGGYLTPAGKDLLDKLREKHRDHRTMRFADPGAHIPAIALGTALFGPPAIANLPEIGPLHQEIQNHIGSATSRSQTATSGCGGGCSAGCGHGCGGGGCGGCGD